MSAFPGSPRLLKSGLVLLDPTTGTVQRVITLQYNPERLTRTLQAQTIGPDAGDRSQAQEFWRVIGHGGAPIEASAPNGGGGGNRTRVRKPIPKESYRRVRPIKSRAPPLRPAGSVTRQLD